MKEIIVSKLTEENVAFKSENGPFTIAFVYSKNHGDFVVKGLLNDVKDYLKTKGPYVVRMSFYHKGRQRGYWTISLRSCFISEPGKGDIYPNKYKVYKKDKIILTFKRMPQTWIPEYDQLLNI